jgi:hypothetical protein
MEKLKATTGAEKICFYIEIHCRGMDGGPVVLTDWQKADIAKIYDTWK